MLNPEKHIFEIHILDLRILKAKQEILFSTKLYEHLFSVQTLLKMFYYTSLAPKICVVLRNQLQLQ